MPSLSPLNYDNYSNKRKPRGGSDLDVNTFENILGRGSPDFEKSSG
jgi:hypothetical protein